jgi:hypothetical protein
MRVGMAGEVQEAQICLGQLFKDESKNTGKRRKASFTRARLFFWVIPGSAARWLTDVFQNEPFDCRLTYFEVSLLFCLMIIQLNLMTRVATDLQFQV